MNDSCDLLSLSDSIQKRIKHNETAFIDPRYSTRSKAEATIVDAIKRCFVYEPNNRISVFELVSILRQAYQELSSNA